MFSTLFCLFVLLLSGRVGYLVYFTARHVWLNHCKRYTDVLRFIRIIKLARFCGPRCCLFWRFFIHNDVYKKFNMPTKYGVERRVRFSGNWCQTWRLVVQRLAPTVISWWIVKQRSRLTNDTYLAILPSTGDWRIDFHFTALAGTLLDLSSHVLLHGASL